MKLVQLPGENPSYIPRLEGNMDIVLFAYLSGSISSRGGDSNTIVKISQGEYPEVEDPGILFVLGQFEFSVKYEPNGYPNLPALAEAIKQREVRILATPLPTGPNTFMERFFIALEKQGIVVEVKDVEDDVEDDVQPGADDF